MSKGTPFTREIVDRLDDLEVSVNTAVDAIEDAIEDAAEQIEDAAEQIEGVATDVTDIKTAIGDPTDTDIATDIANVQSAVDSIPTDDIATALSTHDSDIKTLIGDPIDTDIATDIANVQSVVDAIPTTAMRGTDNALLASNYTAPDNTNIANIHNIVKAEGSGDLASIKSTVEAIPTDDVATALSTHDSEIKAIIGDPADTDIATDIANVQSVVDAIPTTAMRGTDNALLASNYTAPDNTNIANIHNIVKAGGTGDLASIKSTVEAIPTTAMRGTDNAALASSALSNATWTDAKAAYLDAKISEVKKQVCSTEDPGDSISKLLKDNLNAPVGSIPTTAMRGTDNAYLAANGARIEVTKIQWCNPEDIKALISFADTGADVDFPSVKFSDGCGFIPSGATAQKVYLGVTFSARTDTSGSGNGLIGGKIRIMKSGGSWGTDDIIAQVWPAMCYFVGADGTLGGDVVEGVLDLTSEVDSFNDVTYLVRSEETERGDAIVAAGSSLSLADVHTYLKVIYTP